ncbi:hypothetical protein [Rhizobium rhizoryzae]|uniref:hypothetical protein n=1 Tax=Rhizobium rhizoryzae TaxID=451876 RepID=UPI00289A4D80|nr:hypothetical protein [Rhizobium rhizoryzae]
MFALSKVITCGLAVATVTSALAVTAPAAEARDDFAAGLAGGLVGGLIGGAIASQPRGPVYEGPVYIDPPPPPPPRRVYYERTYYRPAPAPRCHYEWRENDWGEAFRVRVCPY